MNAKINISFDHRSLLSVPVTRVIRQCVLATLQAEKVPVPCEINVLLTNDDGIHAINLASRQVDRPTDVLSFPMFRLTPEHLPRDWPVSPGRYGHFSGAGQSAGGGIRPLGPPGGGVSHHPLHAPLAGL